MKREAEEHLGREVMAERKSSRRLGMVDLAREMKLGTEVLAFDEHEVVQLLLAAIAREGNQTAYARRHGLERTGINMILSGKRPVSDAIMKALALRKVCVSAAAFRRAAGVNPERHKNSRAHSEEPSAAVDDNTLRRESADL